MKLVTFICNKLARDKTIETMRLQEITTKHRQLTQTELKKAHMISSIEIETAQSTKRQKRGGFEKGVFLESITLAEENPWAKSFRAAPDRYLEQS